MGKASSEPKKVKGRGNMARTYSNTKNVTRNGKDCRREEGQGVREVTKNEALSPMSKKEIVELPTG